jgi:hypothetical protein
MSEERQLDDRTRRRIRWTVIILAITALAFYVGAFIRQMG